jgi:hypothetical protein
MALAIPIFTEAFHASFPRDIRADSLANPNAAASPKSRVGKLGWILLRLLGIPIPALLISFLLRGCT